MKKEFKTNIVDMKSLNMALNVEKQFKVIVYNNSQVPITCTAATSYTGSLQTIQPDSQYMFQCKKNTLNNGQLAMAFVPGDFLYYKLYVTIDA